MARINPNLFIMVGIALAGSSFVLMDLNWSGVGVIENMLMGAKILDTEIEARWPLLAGFALICFGFFGRINSN